MVVPNPPHPDHSPEAGNGDVSRSPRNKLRRAFRVAVPAAMPGSPGTSGSPGMPANPPAAAAMPQVDVPTRGNLRAFLQARRQRIAAGMPAQLAREVVELPTADVLQTDHGPLWRRELRYPVAHLHGRIALQRAREFDRERLAKMAKSPSFSELSSDECLFLDTETTGLSGGAGTVVFAYGMAFFEGDELVLEQLFLRDFGEEPAMLHHIAQRLQEHPVPVTFVGKSYDRHRIAARLAVHKIKAPVLTDRHLDLYHVIRRQFGKQWPNSRLHTAEERLLGLYRDDDLPGSEAPAAFLAWVRDRTGPVDRVLEHNRLDVLSLAALLGVVTDS